MSLKGRVETTQTHADNLSIFLADLRAEVQKLEDDFEAYRTVANARLMALEAHIGPLVEDLGLNANG